MRVFYKSISLRIWGVSSQCFVLNSCYANGTHKYSVDKQSTVCRSWQKSLFNKNYIPRKFSLMQNLCHIGVNEDLFLASSKSR